MTAWPEVTWGGSSSRGRPNLRSVGPNEMLARIGQEAPRTPWAQFLQNTFTWKAGEHIGLIGPTGLGKTTMLINLLPLHPYVVVFVTKPEDETMQALVDRKGWHKMERWVGLDPKQFPHRILWPDATRLESEHHQQEVFHQAFAKIYREKGWVVALDELWYLDNILHLDRDIKTYLLQARSLRISLLMGTQRPAWVPVEVYSQCTHLFFWRTNDENDLKRISGIGWRSADLIREVVANLEPHQALYVNTRTGAMARTRCPEVKV